MHYTTHEKLIEGIAKRMDPSKYTWSEEGKRDLRKAAVNLLAYIDGFREAADAEESLFRAKDGTVTAPTQGVYRGGIILTDQTGQASVPRTATGVQCINAGESIQTRLGLHITNDGKAQFTASPAQPSPAQPYTVGHDRAED